MPISEYDLNNVDLLLHDAKRCTWFTAKLLRLISTADMQNRAKLAQVYPEEVKLVCEYLGHRVPEKARG